jgi:hypothetical protein
MAFSQRGVFRSTFSICLIIVFSLLLQDVAAANVVHLSIEKRQFSSASSLAERNSVQQLRSRQAFQEVVYNNLSLGGYMANVVVGTPGQILSLQISTGSSDTFIMSSTADVCKTAASGGCIGGACK